MLKQRVITALVLLAILLPVLIVPQPLPFGIVSLIFVSAAGWEWARLNALQGAGAVLMGAIVFAGGAAVLAAPDAVIAETLLARPGFWAAASVTWVLGGAWTLRFGIRRWTALPEALRWALGTLLLWLAWFALLQAKRMGLNFLLSVFCLAWAADIAAYFGGRAFGRRKLAPSISPGKSWEGAGSGLAGALLVAAVWIGVDSGARFDSPSLYTLVFQQGGVAAVLLCVPALVAMTIVGDLFESCVKRVAGAKDSSGLLPGHGGVLDRIDALLPLLPIVWGLVLWTMVAA